MSKLQLTRTSPDMSYLWKQHDTCRSSDITQIWPNDDANTQVVTKVKYSTTVQTKCLLYFSWDIMYNHFNGYFPGLSELAVGLWLPLNTAATIFLQDRCRTSSLKAPFLKYYIYIYYNIIYMSMAKKRTKKLTYCMWDSVLQWTCHPTMSRCLYTSHCLKRSHNHPTRNHSLEMLESLISRRDDKSPHKWSHCLRQTVIYYLQILQWCRLMIPASTLQYHSTTVALFRKIPI